MCPRRIFIRVARYIASRGVLNHVLSAITSPASFEVVAAYQDYWFRGLEILDYPTRPPVRGMLQADRVKEKSSIGRNCRRGNGGRGVR